MFEPAKRAPAWTIPGWRPLRGLGCLNNSILGFRSQSLAHPRLYAFARLAGSNQGYAYRLAIRELYT